MHLFELAMELGVRSAEMAEAAPSLGFDDVTPTSVLTPEQVQAFRTRYAPAPSAVQGASTAYPGVQPAAPTDWGAPPPVPTGSGGGGAGGAGGGGGGRVVQMAVIGVAVVGVLGLFAFMFANSGTDQKRLDRIAAAGAVDEGPAVTGPNGKPLTAAEREGLAKMGAAKEAQDDRACAALEPISTADRRGVPSNLRTIDEIRPFLVTELEKLHHLYDAAMAAAPEWKDELWQLQRMSQAVLESIRGVTSAEQLEPAMAEAVKPYLADGFQESAKRLDDFAQATCGFSVNQN
ncbi:MAG: hypothetical protein JWO77_2023 [Ilumatobacteraceae bacterium]|nr:hypothetical protein [Ilumatobacteraceae bacterium]